MAKIKCEINEDSTAVKFEAVEIGEIFVSDGMPYYKPYCRPGVENYYNAISLTECGWRHFHDDDLVAYVKSAELKLTI